MIAGIVRDHPRLAQPDADIVQPLGEKGEVGVLRAAGQDLVADDQDAGGDGLGLGFAGRHALLGCASFVRALDRQMRGSAQPDAGLLRPGTRSAYRFNDYRSERRGSPSTRRCGRHSECSRT